MSTSERKRLFVANDPQPLRIDRKLAEEIGLLESIVLLQIEYLLVDSQNYRDGRYWMYNTLKTMKTKFFPWLSIATLSRTLINLETAGLIIRGNFNKLGYDRTQWFTLDFDGIQANLKSVRVTDDGLSQNEKRPSQTAKTVSQNAKSSFKNGKTESQNETTVPNNIPNQDTKESHRQTAAPPPVEPTSPIATPQHNVVDVFMLAPDAAMPPTPEPEKLPNGQQPPTSEPETVSLLRAAGITATVARELNTRYGSVACRQQLAWLPFRKATDKPAVLVQSIKEGWSKPVGAATVKNTHETAGASHRGIQSHTQARPKEESAIGTPAGLSGVEMARAVSGLRKRGKSE